MSGGEIKLKLGDEVRQRMVERHISENEVRHVVQNAESSGQKAYQPDASRYLAMLRIGNATFYVEYSIEDDMYAVITTYAHKTEING